ncbi:FAD/NAD(P)-binding domain-containing protein [Daldinia loculata]|nr:FAD/NAD(P)-binding domain-containing protein [Daldinia loculata]
MPPSTRRQLPVLIVGAGVAGLTLAQGLRLSSIAFRLFERHPQSYPFQGHRFRISNETHTALSNLLSSPLQTLLGRTAPENPPFSPRYIDATKLDFPIPTSVNPPSVPVDRAWFRMLTALDIGDAIEYGKDLESYELVQDYVRVKFVDGSIVYGQLLIGSDGVKSRVRMQLQPYRKLLDLDRWVLWGRTPITEGLKEKILPDLLSWCMYLDAENNVQTVVEPMIWSRSARQESEGRLPDFSDYIYWVVCTAPFQYSDILPRTAEEKKAFLERAMETWHPALKLLFRSAAHDMSACIPILSSKPDIEVSTATSKRVLLIGDAAHPMSPMGGSGADTAIKDATDLARTIAEEGITDNSITGFQVRMEARAKEKIEHSFRGGQKFWRGGEWTDYAEIDV